VLINLIEALCAIILGNVRTSFLDPRFTCRGIGHFSQIGGCCWIFGFAWWLMGWFGRREGGTRGGAVCPTRFVIPSKARACPERSERPWFLHASPPADTAIPRFARDDRV